MKTTHNTNDSNIFLLTNKTKDAMKEIFDIKSKNGINIAGRTSKLDRI